MGKDSVDKNRRARQKANRYYRHTVIPAAEEIARLIIEEARISGDPVVFVTGNSCMPPLRSFPAAEEVWQSLHRDSEPELFAWLAEHVESVLSREDVLLSSPDGDNSLYAVDMRRWQLKEGSGDYPDLNGEWEPVSLTQEVKRVITVRCRYCDGRFDRTGSSLARYCCSDCAFWANNSEFWDDIPRGAIIREPPSEGAPGRGYPGRSPV